VHLVKPEEFIMDRMETIKPGSDHFLCTQIGLKGADAVLYALIVNVGASLSSKASSGKVRIM
jgi:hypothetical protein